MDALNSFFLTLDGYLGSADWFPFALLGVGLFFTVYLGLPQIRYFGHAWAVLRGKYDDKSDPGDTTHFQALSTALSGTVGTGNIGGVGLAIYLGGPAALFWMWMTAFLGMATKMVEVSLSHRYREVAENGTMAGGPMYYMEKGLNMKWLAVAFAVATVISSFGTGNMPQINNIAVSVETSFGLSPYITGAVLAVLLGLVIVGGIHRIALIASALVPTMSLLYLVGALSVILMNYENIIPSFTSIFSDAFTGSSAIGGFLGAGFAYAFQRGVNRGLFSNEAGQGSAPIAHASAKADEHVSEGLVSMLEPFIDTIIICTITGLVILSSGAWHQKFDNTFSAADMVIVSGTWTDNEPQQVAELRDFVRGKTSAVTAYTGPLSLSSGMSSDEVTVLHANSVAEAVRFFSNGSLMSGSLNVEEGRIVDPGVEVRGKSLVHSSVLTTQAFTFGLAGESGKYIVSLALVLFAFSTAIAWSYYGDRAIIYLAGFRYVLPYRIVYCLAFFVAAFADTTIIWNFTAVAIVLMTLPNLFGIMMLHRQVKTMVGDYWRAVKSGQDPRTQD